MKLKPNKPSLKCTNCGCSIADQTFNGLCSDCFSKSEKIIGFWHGRPGSTKLICYGSGAGEVKDIVRTFATAFPNKDLKNLTLTFDRTAQEYEFIMLEQQAEGGK